MTDENIVSLYWDRSENALHETEKMYGRYFRYIAGTIVKNEEDAKEIVNDAYLKAWQLIPPERPLRLKAFIGKITRQLAINRLEKNTAQKRGGAEYDLALSELAECILQDGEGEDIGDLLALQEALNRFLRDLPQDTRRMFIQRYWYMCSIAEIAEEFSASESKVKMQLLRTREKFREFLKREGFER